MAKMTLEEFLAPISKALGHDGVPEAPARAFDSRKGPQRGMYEGLSHEDVVEMFVREAEALGTVVRRADEAGVAEGVAALTVELGEGEGSGRGSAVRVALPADVDVRVADALEVAGCSCVLWDPSDAAASREAVLGCDVGVTFAQAVLAETGTIVQECSEATPRSLSLLPPTHIAVVRSADVVPRMTQLMDAYEDRVAAGEGMPSCVSLVSGPSNTADIELVRVVGVHGPVRTAVLLLD